MMITSSFDQFVEGHLYALNPHISCRRMREEEDSIEEESKYQQIDL